MEVKNGKKQMQCSFAPVGAVQSSGCHARPLLPCLGRRQFIPNSPHVSLYKNVTLGAAAGWERGRKALNCAAAIPSGSSADLENLAKAGLMQPT